MAQAADSVGGPACIRQRAKGTLLPLQVWALDHHATVWLDLTVLVFASRGVSEHGLAVPTHGEKLALAQADDPTGAAH